MNNHEWLFDMYAERGKRQIENAERHIANGRVDYAAGSLAKAQRNFDKAVALFTNAIRDYREPTFAEYVVNAMADLVAADLDDLLMRGSPPNSYGLFGNQTLPLNTPYGQRGISVRLLHPSASRVG